MKLEISLKTGVNLHYLLFLPSVISSELWHKSWSYFCWEQRI